MGSWRRKYATSTGPELEAGPPPHQPVLRGGPAGGLAAPGAEGTGDLPRDVVVRRSRVGPCCDHEAGVSGDVSGSDPEESDSGVPWAVRAGEAVALVEAFRQAQEVEAALRRLLDDYGIPADVARPVATLDSHGRPAVRLTLRADDPTRLRAVVRAALRCICPQSSDAA